MSGLMSRPRLRVLSASTGRGVENFRFLPSSQNGDITNVWLKGA